MKNAIWNESFENWWDKQGRAIDPDTSDVPWFDKRKELCEHAFEAGILVGMARAGNYTASHEVSPTAVTFANGTTVRVSTYGSLIVERQYQTFKTWDEL